MKKRLNYMIILLLSLLLTGCMYPNSKKVENRVPYEDQVQMVQHAVEQYQKDHEGLLPIKTMDAKVPIYQKYPIDFTQLMGKYMSEPPGNAYESGGVFQYVLIDVETNPTVKIFDLRIVDAIQEYGLRLQMYKDKHTYPPYKEQIDTYVFTIDYKKLGYDQLPTIKSPYSQTELGIVMDAKGDIFVDYTPDLMQKLKDNKNVAKQGDDIRRLLTEDSVFVPAFSLPYTVSKKDEPVFMTN